MRQYSVDEAQHLFDELIEAALKGEQVLIADGGELVHLVPIATSSSFGANTRDGAPGIDAAA